MSQHLYAACYAIILNEKWEVLLNQRKNTGYFDGWWTLIAWHIEPWELASECMIREIREESWLEVTKKMIEQHYVIHRIIKDSREYFDVSFIVKWWVWTPIITEPEKCTAVKRFALDDLPEYMPQENRVFLDAYKKNPHKGGFEELYLKL